MNARLTWSIVVGALILAVAVVLVVYGTHAGVILGRLGLRVF
ncbi:hypothetical protein [Streptomyces jeddahensis]|uniref:Uncharacterized protein n=1 Tax=Streptomyces jeddahensis TaxID=1716141 RepID=A0A177HWA3_9ACTN|nr:hypothetical protein [Streptomyces jeddahensis]OAH14877.1 hypothetical protein STSP_17140 [Streptomyces jeddahensis]